MKYTLICFLVYWSILSPVWSSDKQANFFNVSFETADNGEVHAFVYGSGDHAIVLAHGAIFNKESWDPFAKMLTTKGFKVLALDFRGYGASRLGSKPDALYEDILAAVRYLRKQGAQRVSVVGASMGGGAAANAAVISNKGEINKLVLLSPAPGKNPERIKANILVIASTGESLLPRITAQYKNMPEPKRFVLLNGNAHAQHIFKTDQANKVQSKIIDFLCDSVL